jgi:hypothetical protein
MPIAFAARTPTGVAWIDTAVRARAAALIRRHNPSTFLPDKAILLLDTSCLLSLEFLGLEDLRRTLVRLVLRVDRDPLKQCGEVDHSYPRQRISMHL